jgi:hypothetical protein
VTTIDRRAFQILESSEVDFEKMTWTFTITGSNEVGAGLYAVLPSETFMKMSNRLAHAEGLLQQWRGGHLDEGFKKRVESHFDPEPFI